MYQYFMFYTEFPMPDFSAQKGNMENRLISDLLSNYSRFGRPISDVTKPVKVTIKFYLTQLMSLVGTWCVCHSCTTIMNIYRVNVAVLAFLGDF